MSDTNTQPESREEAKRQAILKIVGYGHPRQYEICEYGYEAGYRAGLAARSPRDEDAVEATALELDEYRCRNCGDRVRGGDGRYCSYDCEQIDLIGEETLYEG